MERRGRVVAQLVERRACRRLWVRVPPARLGVFSKEEWMAQKPKRFDEESGEFVEYGSGDGCGGFIAKLIAIVVLLAMLKACGVM